MAGAERAAAHKVKSDGDGKDGIIWRLEYGTVLRAAGKYEESNTQFDQAEAKINKYSEEAKIKLGDETLALLSNQAELPYRGRTYDGIMLNTYKALNFIKQGDIEKARVEFNRAAQRQKDAVEDNQKAIKKTQDAINKRDASERKQIDRAKNDSAVNSQLGANYTELNGLKAYGDYVNPFTDYLYGLFYMTTAAEPSDLDKAAWSLKRASSCAPENRFVKADVDALDGVMQGKAIAPTTYVIFETGRAPVRDQFRIDIPIIVTSVSYVGAAFPVLRFQGGYASSLTVRGAGVEERSELLCSMDSVIGNDFKNELPTIHLQDHR